MALSKIDTAAIATDAIEAAQLKSDAITGGDLPTGSVLQVQSFPWTAQSNTNSTSFTNMGQIGAITTTQASSKVIVISNIPLQVYGAENTRYMIELRSSHDSYGSALNRHNAVNYSDASGQWVKPHLGWNHLHNHGQSVGTTINYRTYIARLAGTQNAYYSDFWGDGTQSYETTLIEIAG